MPITRATVSLQMKSGIPADSAVNVWHFQSAIPFIPTDYSGIGNALATMYNTLGEFLSSTVSRSASVHTISFATLSAGVAGPGDDTVTPPVNVYPFAIGTAPASAMNLPAEVAICLSMAAALGTIPENGPGGTRPRSRRRGRIFVGPLSGSPVQKEADTDRARINPLIAGAIAQAASDMDGLLPGAIGTVVYSPTNGTAERVVEFSVDDAFDTIRSRGEQATLRVVRSTSGA